MVCIDIAKGTLTSREALRNYGEISSQLNKKHAEEVLRKIQIKILKELQESEDKDSIQD
jgi:hypothetical protein